MQNHKYINNLPTLSVVVPVYCEGPGLKAFVRDLIASLTAIADFEVIVVNGASQALDLEDCAQLKVLQSAKGRAVQMNQGVMACQGDYVLFLHCDTHLPADIGSWWARVTQHNPSWGFFPVRLSGSRWMFRVIERAISWRSRWRRIATGDQAQFVSRTAFDAVGGFPHIPLMEDVAISHELKKIAPPMIWQRPVVTSSRRWEKHGVCKTIVLMWWLRLAFSLGVSPVRLARWYGYQPD